MIVFYIVCIVFAIVAVFAWFDNSEENRRESKWNAERLDDKVNSQEFKDWIQGDRSEDWRYYMRWCDSDKCNCTGNNQPYLVVAFNGDVNKCVCDDSHDVG